MNIRKNVQVLSPTHGIKLVRVLHDAEIWTDNWRPELPQVHPIFPNHFSIFNEDWQWCSRYANYRISAIKWTRVYTGHRFMTNGQGFEMDGDTRNNYVLGIRGVSDPKVENLTTGGSVHLGYFVGDKFYFAYMLNVSGPVPTYDKLQLNPWQKVIGTSCDANQKPRRFPQGELPSGEIVPIIHPFITNVTRFPSQYTDAYRVQVWPHSWLPDPYTIYGGLTNKLYHG